MGDLRAVAVDGSWSVGFAENHETLYGQQNYINSCQSHCLESQDVSDQMSQWIYFVLFSLCTWYHFQLHYLAP
jgi:hypothetical protein